MKYLLAFIISLSLYAHNGDRVGNGSESIDINGRKYLLDFATEKVCHTDDMGDYLLDYIPELKSVFNSLDNLFWYFSYDLQETLSETQICLTDAELIPVENADSGSVFKQENSSQLKTQIGIYIPSRKTIVINSQELNELIPGHRPFVIIHEILHQYYGENVIVEELDEDSTEEQKQEREEMIEELRSLESTRYMHIHKTVQLIRDVHRGVISDPLYFSEQLAFNEIEFESYDPALKPYQYPFKFMAANATERVGIIKDGEELESIFNISPDSYQGLLSETHQSISNEDWKEALIEVTRNICYQKELSFLRGFFFQVQVGAVIPRLICLEVARESNDEEFLKALMKIDINTSSFLQLIEEFKNVSFYVENFRIQTKDDWSLISRNNSYEPNGQNFLSLPLVLQKQPVLSFKAREFYLNFLYLIQAGDLEKFRSYISQNESFYDALSVNTITLRMKNVVQSSSEEVLFNEEQLVEEKIKKLIQSLFVKIRSELNKEINEEGKVDTFLNEINQQRLGIKF